MNPIICYICLASFIPQNNREKENSICPTCLQIYNLRGCIISLSKTQSCNLNSVMSSNAQLNDKGGKNNGRANAS